MKKVTLLILLMISGAVMADECRQKGESLLLRVSLSQGDAQVAWSDISARISEDGVICVPQDKLKPLWSSWRLPESRAAVYMLPESDLVISQASGAEPLFNWQLSLYAAMNSAPADGESSCLLQRVRFESGSVAEGDMNKPEKCHGAGSQLADEIRLMAADPLHLNVQFLRIPDNGGIKKGLKGLFEKQDIDDGARKRLRKF